MKYIVILGDGMADYPLDILNGKTPLEKAFKPNIDELCHKGILGLVKTIPDGMKPGSDVANLSILGYAPDKYYSGRSPLEALSIGIDMEESDIAVRCNFVTLSDDEPYEEKAMVDYSAGEISTQEAKMLVEFLQAELGDELYRLYAGVSYRHCLIRKDAQLGTELTPPHDISGKKIKEYLPKGLYGDEMLSLMKKAADLLKNHPVNQERIKDGKNPANSIWFWGEGKKPVLDAFEEKYGLKGGVISAVDLIKGIGIGAKMQVIEVEGATGTYDTNFRGKAEAAVKALQDGLDYVYIHMEAPDECGHQGDVDHKILSIELIDSVVVKYIVEKMNEMNEPYSILLAPDHPTPISLRTHVSDSVPFIIYRSDKEEENIFDYSEANAKESGVYFDNGESLAREFLCYQGTMEKDPEKIVSNDGILDEHENKKEIGQGSTEIKEESNQDIKENTIEETEDRTFEEESQTSEKEKEILSPSELKKNEIKLKGKLKEGRTKAERKKILIIAIASVLAIIIIGLGIGLPIYFTQRYNFSVSESADFAKLLSKKSGDYDRYTYVLKKDIIVDGDLVIEHGINIDLNKKTLKVNGNLILKTDSADAVLIGTKKGKAYIAGGSILAQNIQVEAIGGIEMTSHIQAESITLNGAYVKFTSPTYLNTGLNDTVGLSIEAAKVEINTLYTSEQGAHIEVRRAEELTVSGGNISSKIVMESTNAVINSGAIIAEADLANSSTLTSNGTVETIRNGIVVRLLNGHSGSTYSDIETLGIYRASDDSFTIENCGKVVYLETLAIPSDIVVYEEGSAIYAQVGVVKGAKNYLFRIDDGEWTQASSNKIDITDKIISKTGDHKIEVKAVGDYNSDLTCEATSNGEYYLYFDGESVTTTYEYTIVLESPKNIIVNNSEVSFDNVNFATSYVITIDGKNHTFTHDTSKQLRQSFDISEFVSVAGVHTVRIVATSDIEGVRNSNPSIATQITIPKLSTIDLTTTSATVNDGTTVIKWNGVENCSSYAIYVVVEGEDKLICTTTLTQITITGYDVGTTFKIISVGQNYYESSDKAAITSVIEE